MKTNTKTRLILTSLCCLALLSGVACGKKTDSDGDSNSTSSTSDAAESGLTAAQAIMDDQDNSSFAFIPRSSYSKYASAESLIKLLIDQAYAASCARPRSQACVSGVRSITYSACTAGASTLDGSARLEYSSASCSLNTGETVNRKLNFSLTGPRGGVVSHSSETASDYLGQSYGGGGRLEVTSAGWN